MQFRGVPVKRGIIACMIFFSHICDLSACYIIRILNCNINKLLILAKGID